MVFQEDARVIASDVLIGQVLSNRYIADKGSEHLKNRQLQSGGLRNLICSILVLFIGFWAVVKW